MTHTRTVEDPQALRLKLAEQIRLKKKEAFTAPSTALPTLALELLKLEAEDRLLESTIELQRNQIRTEKEAQLKAAGETERKRKEPLEKRCRQHENYPICENCGTNVNVQLRGEISQPIFRPGCSYEQPVRSPYDWYFEYICKGPDVKCWKAIAVFPELEAKASPRRKRAATEIVVDAATLTSIEKASTND
jgi:hypothetical protein